jgi:hypothetical protein
VITVANRIYGTQEYAEALEQKVHAPDWWTKCLVLFQTRSCARSTKATLMWFLLSGITRQDFLNWVRSDAFVKGHGSLARSRRNHFHSRRFWRSMRWSRIPVALI